MLLAILRCWKETNSPIYLETARKQAAFLLSLTSDGHLAEFAVQSKTAGTGQMAELACYVRAMAAMAVVEKNPHYAASAREYGQKLVAMIHRAETSTVDIFPEGARGDIMMPLLNSQAIDESGCSPAAAAVEAMADLLALPNTERQLSAQYRQAALSIRSRYIDICVGDPLAHAALIQALNRKELLPVQ